MDKPIPRRRFSAKIIAAGVIAVVIALTMYSQLNGADARSFRVDATKLSIATVKDGTFSDVIPIYGMVMPHTSVFLDAIDGGMVDEIYVREGRMVEPGMALLRFRNTAFQLQIYSQEARISEQLDINANTRLSIEKSRVDYQTRLNDIDLELKRALRRLNQAEQLKKEGVISASEYQDLVDAYDHQVRAKQIMVQANDRDEPIRLTKIAQLAESERRLQSHLRIVRDSLGQLVVRAPVRGQLTSLQAEIGESKAPGQRLGQIDVLERYKIIADVDSFYLPEVREGQKAVVTLDQRPYTLVVEKIYPEVKDGKFRVDFGFEHQSPENLVRGQNIPFQLQMSEPRKALVMRSGSFHQETGGQWAFVVGADGKSAERRTIKLGRRNPNEVEVLEGLAPGDKVVVSSYANFASMDRLLLNQ